MGSLGFSAVPTLGSKSSRQKTPSDRLLLVGAVGFLCANSKPALNELPIAFIPRKVCAWKSSMVNGLDYGGDFWVNLTQMQLTASESKTFEMAKRLQAKWSRTRWLVLMAGVVMVWIGIIHLSNIPESPMLLMLGLFQIYRVCRYWRGGEITTLLLKAVGQLEPQK